MIHQDLKNNPVKNEKFTRKMKNPLNNLKLEKNACTKDFNLSIAALLLNV
jgi:hypothetical protein